MHYVSYWIPSTWAARRPGTEVPDHQWLTSLRFLIIKHIQHLRVFGFLYLVLFRFVPLLLSDGEHMSESTQTFLQTILFGFSAHIRLCSRIRFGRSGRSEHDHDCDKSSWSPRQTYLHSCFQTHEYVVVLWWYTSRFFHLWSYRRLDRVGWTNDRF